MRRERAHHGAVGKQLLHVRAVPDFSLSLLAYTTPCWFSPLVQPLRNATLAPSLARLVEDATKHSGPLTHQDMLALRFIPSDPREQHPGEWFSAAAFFLAVPTLRLIGR